MNRTSYLKRGKVFKKSKLQSGNSIKLLKELEELKNDEALIKIKDNSEYKALMDFYNIVKDSVENQDGVIKFC